LKFKIDDDDRRGFNLLSFGGQGKGPNNQKRGNLEDNPQRIVRQAEKDKKAKKRGVR